LVKGDRVVYKADRFTDSEDSIIIQLAAFPVVTIAIQDDLRNMLTIGKDFMVDNNTGVVTMPFKSRVVANSPIASVVNSEKRIYTITYNGGYDLDVEGVLNGPKAIRLGAAIQIAYIFNSLFSNKISSIQKTKDGSRLTDQDELIPEAVAILKPLRVVGGYPGRSDR
jgi:hypothetical protein